ncbi:MAG TPA: hypothetical protein VJM51_01795 [Dehalococcoidia bacterium]|nr:hypothetical protein [Dehalococcoidia bacterium]
MPLKVPEKILANIVVLPAENVSVNINAAEIQSIFKDPGLQVQVMQPPGLPNQQVVITSLRQQIQLVMNPNGQIVVEDKSADPNPKGIVAEIVNEFVALLAGRGLSKFRAYGFNFHLTFDTPGEELAGKFLSERFVRADLIQHKGNISVEGAGLRLYFDSADARCDLRLEPAENERNQPRLFAAINYHYPIEDRGLPDRASLQADFLGKWMMFTQLLERLVV